MKRVWSIPRRGVCLYVEWVEQEEIDAVLRILHRLGARVWEIDEDIDLEDYPQAKIKRAHTVFRFRVERLQPAYELMAAVAQHPSVYSVSEM